MYLPPDLKTQPRLPMASPTCRPWGIWELVPLLVLGGMFLEGFVGKVTAADPLSFNMVVSAGAAGCLPDALGQVTITPLGPVEQMDVQVSGLPASTEFDFFVIQLPKAPFGLAWYQGDIETDGDGNGQQTFIGRFNIETFIVAQPPGDQPAPVVFDQPPFPDADHNPATEPVHTFHLGLWFGSPDDAAAAGCPDTVTRFNGPHTAGIQVLNTSNFDDLAGPLIQLDPSVSGTARRRSQRP